MSLINTCKGLDSTNRRDWNLDGLMEAEGKPKKANPMDIIILMKQE